MIHVLQEQGAPEGETIATITSLAQAEEFYLNFNETLDRFVEKHKG